MNQKEASKIAVKAVAGLHKQINELLTQRNLAENRYEEVKRKVESMVTCLDMRLGGVCRDLERAGKELRIRRQMDKLYRDLLAVYREPDTLMVDAEELRRQIKGDVMEAFDKELYGMKMSIASTPENLVAPAPTKSSKSRKT